ncbi:DUF58 domain-containing protein [Streptomyces sp. NPDC047028]|uniref:DUF58 domain-containing protein n=1 Tax=Streptomyces sp. NPDC047028 TaxID=3155793 RepID=UPI0033CBEEA7
MTAVREPETPVPTAVGTEMATQEVVVPQWRPSPLLRRLSATAVLALAAAVALGRAELLVVAAPMLWWLAAASRTRPHTLTARTRLDTDRCTEGDDIVLTVSLHSGTEVDLVSATLALPAGATVLDRPSLPLVAVTAHELRWRLRPGRWGRWSLGPPTVRIHATGGLLQASVSCPAADVAVLPLPAAVGTGPLPALLPRRTGDHPAGAPGEGSEFEGLRPYQPGDRPRQVNWAASARRRTLFVTTRQDERSFDLILLVDAFLRVGPVGNDSLDLSVRGATGLARAHLRRGERVGVVAVGGLLRGLAPGVGGHQLQRIADAVLDVRLDDSYVDPDIARLPRTVLPPGALTVLFSPLLDERARLTALDLRRRGHAVVIIDVLCDEPRPDRRDRVGRLSLRLWRLDREADRFELGRWGVPVLPWDGTAPLDAVLTPLRRRSVEGRWRHGT